MITDKILSFLKEIEKFKTCERTCHTTREGRPESDAEHSWHLALFLMLFEGEFEGVDVTRMLKMALIHDLPELYTGDTNPYRDDTEHKEENEKKAAGQLCASLPHPSAENLLSLFEEYMAQSSTESKIVKSADKLLPLIQNLCTNSRYSSYRKKRVVYEEVKEYMDPFFPEGILKELYLRLLAEAREKGIFFEPKMPE